jgi:hypothetical protein
MGSALGRVKWELELNPRWRLDPNFYLEQSLTAVTEALTVPPPFDEMRSRELLTRIRNIPQIVRDGEANLQNPPAPFAKVAIEALAGVEEKLAGMTPSLAPVTTLQPAELAATLAEAGTALEEYRSWLQKKLPESPQHTEVGREAYNFSDAYQLQSDGFLGNVGGNTLRGPQTSVFDFALMRDFPFHESLGLQFRWEVFNLANAVLLGQSSTNISSSSVGQITSLSGIRA